MDCLGKKEVVVMRTSDTRRENWHRVGSIYIRIKNNIPIERAFII